MLQSHRLSNAIKFTDTSDGAREIHINVETSFVAPDEGSTLPPVHVPTVLSQSSIAVPVYIFVSVKDSGPGLKPGDLALLFKR